MYRDDRIHMRKVLGMNAEISKRAIKQIVFLIYLRLQTSLLSAKLVHAFLESFLFPLI